MRIARESGPSSFLGTPPSFSEFPAMHRRLVLIWLSRAMSALCTAAMAIPGVAYVLEEFFQKRSADQQSHRVARLIDLPPQKPMQVAVVGNRRDAWMSYPGETIGRVWLIRTTDDSVAPDATQVTAFTATCPHLGCTIQQSGRQFVCPCHKATFDTTGKQVVASGGKPISPRDMDSLECRVVQDSKSQQWWVEVSFQRFQQGGAAKQPLS